MGAQDTNPRRVTLVTGATRGIGRAISTCDARSRIVGIARAQGAAAFPGEVVVADLRDEKAVASALADIVARHRITGPVNNAGLNHIQKLGEIDLAAFDEVIAVNLRAAIQCAQAMLPAMLVAMTRCWALELADKGITVNAVGPGPTETEMWNKNNPPDSPTTRAHIVRIPVGRMGQPEKIAGAVAYFMSTEAAFTTGQHLFVCGGLSIV